MAAIELKPQVDEELSRYAESHGMSKDEVLHKALLEYLEDREDYETAVAALQEHERDGRTYSMEEVRKELGLDN